jgi:predicted RNase H-like nuclease (RuvC/YqgF family)
MMKQAILAASLGTMLVMVTAPAQAQYNREGTRQASQYDRNWRATPAINGQIRRDIEDLRRRIERSERRGAISEREWRGLREQVANVRELYRRYARNGLSRNEATALEYRINRIRARLRMERRDYDGRRG